MHKEYSPKIIEQILLEKFLRYIAIDTQSSDDSTTFPSTEKQWNLLKLLDSELRQLGIREVNLDQYGYLTVTIPANLGASQTPVLAFFAHVDTTPEVSGTAIKPQIIDNYQGGDITLPGDNSVVIAAAKNPALKNSIGQTIITTDGTTVLGADDKAGVAILMLLAEILISNPKIKHGEIKIAFNPDEEIGAGMKFFDLKKFRADIGYSIDGGALGELNKETFSADSAIITVDGVNHHPGYAKNIMVNSVRVAADIIARLPKELAPENTTNYQPYIHPHQIIGDVEKSTLKLLLRDFQTEGLIKLKKILEKIIIEVQKSHPKAKITLEIHEAYRNMLHGLMKNPKVTEYLFEAAQNAGANPRWVPTRGGTDGAQLTAQGLPTPNVFTGSENHHSKAEWLSIYGMRKSLETLLNLVQLWAAEPS